jgi:hypothetical protein
MLVEQILGPSDICRHFKKLEKRRKSINLILARDILCSN